MPEAIHRCTNGAPLPCALARGDRAPPGAGQGPPTSSRSRRAAPPSPRASAATVLSGCARGPTWRASPTTRTRACRAAWWRPSPGRATSRSSVSATVPPSSPSLAPLLLLSCFSGVPSRSRTRVRWCGVPSQAGMVHFCGVPSQAVKHCTTQATPQWKCGTPSVCELSCLAPGTVM